MVWLGSHPEIQCPQEENYSLMHDQPAQLVQDMYAQAPYEEYKRAYKNPIDLFFPGTSLAYLDQYFPETKLLVTLRHPVLYVSFLQTLPLLSFFRCRQFSQLGTFCIAVSITL